MITFERPKERVVGIGEHIEGIGVVLDPDDFPVDHVEAIHRQTAQIDESIREMNRKIATGYLSNLPEIEPEVEEKSRTLFGEQFDCCTYGKDSEMVGKALLEYRDNPPVHECGPFEGLLYTMGEILEIVMSPDTEFTTDELITRLAHLMGVDD